MNIQAMMKQAQKLQKDMMNEKNAIDSELFTATSSFVTVEMKGNKELKKVKIDTDSLDSDDIEMLEDMILVAVNDTLNQINKKTEDKMGKFTKGMPGLF